MRTSLFIHLVTALTLVVLGQPNFASDSCLQVTGTRNPLICLNGKWKISPNPPKEFWSNDVFPQDWADILVPGECAMQDFAIRDDQQVVYKKKIHIPPDFRDGVIKLKFEGVYNFARVWVNGQYVCQHRGGFTAWQCEITDLVKPGEDAWLTVEVTDVKDDLSYGSGYAKHQIGGILRSVWLQALPTNHLSKCYIETDLDEQYLDATLKITLQTSQQTGAALELTLVDPQTKKVPLPQKEITMPAGTNEVRLAMLIKNPQKWDAEHPNLYTLRVTVFQDGKELYSFAKKFGFREIEIRGNQLLVNGRPVKLRGACRHDIHPLFGRMTTPEQDKKDVLLAKEANINFIRTSHYPPSEAFLQFCDEFGLYVEVESAVCFVGTHRSREYRTDKLGAAELEDYYLSQVREMVHEFRNHPAVIIWSIGNENDYNDNFKLCYDFIKSTDPTRPVMFSYSGGVPDSVQCYDILSVHYPSYRGDMGNQRGVSIQGFEYDKMPALFDEWAHVACYNKPTLQVDPNVRSFWGQSLDSMWTNLFESQGGLGGAIWGMIDETFMLPESLPGFNQWWGIMDKNILPAMYEGPCVGYGEWGIVDTWRRKKPEFWSTKKAYSPTKVLIREITNFQPDADLQIPVYNRFDHTNLDEIKIQWRYQDKSGSITNADVPPHQKGVLEIPPAHWQSGEQLSIQFLQRGNSLIDVYNLRFGKRTISLPTCQRGTFTVREKNQRVEFSADDFSFALNRQTGLLEDVQKNGITLIQAGPFINLKVPGKRAYFSTIKMDDIARQWQAGKVSYDLRDGIAHISSSGVCDGLSVTYNFQIDAFGTMVLKYKIGGAPAGKKVQEAGIRLIVGDQFDKLSWDRHAYWSAYPDMHLGMPIGEIDLHSDLPMRYRQFPDHPWELDRKDFYYHGIDTKLPLTNIARALKENIYTYVLVTRSQQQLQVLANGDKACRLDITDGGYVLIINSLWDYASLLWGNYMKNVKLKGEYKDTVILCANYRTQNILKIKNQRTKPQTKSPSKCVTKSN